MAALVKTNSSIFGPMKIKIKLNTGEILETEGICTDGKGNELGYLVYCRTDRLFPIQWICPKEQVECIIEDDETNRTISK